ncbi:MAG: hypothetical protein R2941_01145 [Desulfobacterales bacterium]
MHQSQICHSPKCIDRENTCIGDLSVWKKCAHWKRKPDISGGYLWEKMFKSEENCVLFPNVVVYENCRIGNRVRIHANATVGQDGFGYATHKGIHHKIVHIGRVIVKMMQNWAQICAIERALWMIRLSAKRAQNRGSCGHWSRHRIGCLLVPQVGIAGSVVMGHHCVAGGQVGIAGHPENQRRCDDRLPSPGWGTISRTEGFQRYSVPAFEAREQNGHIP